MMFAKTLFEVPGAREFWGTTLQPLAGWLGWWSVEPPWMPLGSVSGEPASCTGLWLLLRVAPFPEIFSEEDCDLFGADRIWRDP